MVSKATVKYWLDWFKFLAEDRLSGPQCDEAVQVLALAEQYAALARQRDGLLAACQRMMRLDDSCDYTGDVPEICPGIAENGAPCHWCEMRAAIAATGEGEVGA